MLLVNCNCRKKLVDKLTEECTENVDKVESTSEKEHKSKCSSCISYFVLFSIFFTICIGITAYFVYYKYMSRNKENVSKCDYTYQTTI